MNANTFVNNVNNVQRPIYRWMALGGAMFLVSDILLAWQVFHDPFPFIDELTWMNYGGGEMLIVYGAIAGLWKYAGTSERGEAKTSAGRG